jgi:hypothetical protein
MEFLIISKLWYYLHETYNVKNKSFLSSNGTISIEITPGIFTCALEDTKGVGRSRKSKNDRQRNDKKTNNVRRHRKLGLSNTNPK